MAALAIGVLASRPDPIEVETATMSRGPVAETVTNTRAGTIKACQRQVPCGLTDCVPR